MSAEVAAWRGSADATARELQEQAREFAGRWQQLAERLHMGGTASAAPERHGSGAVGVGTSIGTAQGEAGQHALSFHRGLPAANTVASQPRRGGPGPRTRSTGQGAAERSLPRLPAKKTQAVFGAQLRQPGEPSPAGGRGCVALPMLRVGADRVQQERSAGTAWSSQGDRYSESKRDAGMVAHMAARWNR